MPKPKNQNKQLSLAELVSKGGTQLKSTISDAKGVQSQGGDPNKYAQEIINAATGYTPSAQTTVKPAVPYTDPSNPYGPNYQAPASAPLGSKENPHQWGSSGVQGSANFGEFVQVMPPGSSTPVTMTVQDAVKFNQAVSQSMPGTSIATTGTTATTQSQEGAATTSEDSTDNGELETNLKSRNAREGVQKAFGKAGGKQPALGQLTGTQLQSDMNNFVAWLKTQDKKYGGYSVNQAGKIVGLELGGKKNFEERGKLGADLEEQYKKYTAEKGLKQSGAFTSGGKKGIVATIKDTSLTDEPPGLMGPPPAGYSPEDQSALDAIAKAMQDQDILKANVDTKITGEIEKSISGTGNKINELFLEGINASIQALNEGIEELKKQGEFSQSPAQIKDNVQGWLDQTIRQINDNFYDSAKFLNETYMNMGYSDKTIAQIIASSAYRTQQRNLLDANSKAKQLEYEGVLAASEAATNRASSIANLTAAMKPLQYSVQGFGTPTQASSNFIATAGQDLQMKLGQLDLQVKRDLGLIQAALEDKKINATTALELTKLATEPLIQLQGATDFSGIGSLLTAGLGVASGGGIPGILAGLAGGAIK